MDEAFQVGLMTGNEEIFVEEANPFGWLSSTSHPAGQSPAEFGAVRAPPFAVSANLIQFAHQLDCETLTFGLRLL